MKDFESKKEKIKLNSEKIRERENKLKIIKRSILLMILFLIIDAIDTIISVVSIE